MTSVLQTICNNYFEARARLPSVRSCAEAAAKGDLSELIQLHQSGDRLCLITITNAIDKGHVDCLQYCHQNGWNLVAEFTHRACANGQLAVLQYLITNGCEWDQYAASNAAVNGHYECLKYAYENGCRMNSSVTLNAAFGGYLDCLRFAHENGCPWDDRVTMYITQSTRSLECLKYAYEHGCYWHPQTVEGIFYQMYSCEDSTKIDCLEYCFSICLDVSTFWNVDFNHIIPQIDFAKVLWRPLFAVDCSNNTELNSAINQVKNLIKKQQDTTYLLLHDCIATDVIKYRIFPYY